MKLKQFGMFLLISTQMIIYNHTSINKTSKPDRRCKFFDIFKIKKKKNRRPQSPVIQFYSSMDNIGNYLPVLGIQKMLGMEPDTWCMYSHSNPADFNFINKHYKCAIIGGAGLLHKCFEPFWKQLTQKCKIPMIIWGIGICLPDKNKKGVDKAIVSAVAKKCSLINVRDELTARYYNLENASITACPTIIYLQDLYEYIQQANNALYSFHPQLVSPKEHHAIKTVLQEALPNLKLTDNIQKKELGLVDIIKKYYCPSKIVITTRLHGAIIAYGLEIPYIAIARDEKLRSFHSKYKNGLIVENIATLKEVIKNNPHINIQPIEYEPVLAFGRQARAWVQEQIAT